MTSTSTSAKPASARSRRYSLLLQRAGDAADPRLHVGAQIGRQLALGDDVGDGEAAARLQHPVGLAQHLPLVAGQIDDAVGDDHVDLSSGRGMSSMCPLRNCTFSAPAVGLVLLGQGQHLVGHVQAIGEAGRADASGREQHVDAAATAQVEHGFAWFELGQRGRIATAERGLHGLLRDGGDVVVGVEVAGDRIGRGPAAAGGSQHALEARSHGGPARRTWRGRSRGPHRGRSGGRVGHGVLLLLNR